MEQVALAAFYLGMVAYSVSGTLFFVDLARRDGSGAGARYAPWALGSGALAHATHVVAASLFSNICPVASLGFGLSLSALVTVLVYLAMRRRDRIHALGVVVAPLALTFLVGAQFLGSGPPTSGSSRGLLAAHISANVLGLSLFLLAGAAGAFYLVQERSIKRHRAPLLGGKLPPLESLDVTEHRLLLAGFPLLTFGIVSGAVFASELGQMDSSALLRAVLAATTWVLVAGVLVLRRVAGWRGRRAAYGTLAGVGCVMLVVGVYIIRAGA